MRRIGMMGCRKGKTFAEWPKTLSSQHFRPEHQVFYTSGPLFSCANSYLMNSKFVFTKHPHFLHAASPGFALKCLHHRRKPVSSPEATHERIR